MLRVSFDHHIVPHALISVMQWKTHSACFLPLSPTHHVLPFSHPSSFHPPKILPK